MKQASIYRAYATTTSYVPPAADISEAHSGPHQKLKPGSPSFYTGRQNYQDQIRGLESAANLTRLALKKMHLLPLPKFAESSLPPAQTAWKSKITLGGMIGEKLNTSRYRKVTSILNEIDELRRIAQAAGQQTLEESIADVVSMFEREDKETVLARGRRKPVKFDEWGRSYTVGKRKTSSARVWIIPVKAPPPPVSSEAGPMEAEDHAAEAEVTNEVTLGPNPNHSSEPPIPVTTSTILVNGSPLADYFRHPADRERIVRPFKIAGLLGAYNVFALVRGGGTTGQSGALSQGIAKGLAAHVPEVQEILRKSKLLRRDPRMVERKKTGRAKARKAYAWVKR
ncbi:SSU ribosomal protein S9P [Sistotremastrum suecicum HHB10207 ss-3]|uniref:SSU ribosomal protein S9P n=1 Tax=Sistotremastrum suecicum HHB10207 ss-3 TaxID=1314776 RepID=A0A166H8S0_9AGAM|nr:SSU ribosomal protein S9P [Sistotremastrum suecicum HHB10207 ss-3]